MDEADTGQALSRLTQAVERLAENQAALQAAVAELVKTNTIKADEESDAEDTGLDYQDSWPEVEVTLAVAKLGDFDAAEQSFHADFTVHLDWVDARLQRGVHYNYNAEHGKFELSKTLRCCKDDMKFFNPSLTIENAIPGEDMLQDAADLPLLFDEVTQDGVDVPWLTKHFQFMGRMSAREVDARYFPFDIERLQIRVMGQEMSGVTSVGKSRMLSLIEPRLRCDYRFSRKQRDPMPGWALARQPEDCMSHMWKVEEDNVIQGTGEMNVLAMGGVVTPTRSAYVLHIVLRRQWFPRYVVDFAISSLQVGGAAISLWVPFNADTLANRMSITLTVLLTLVAAAASRPPVVENLPYPTLHDHYNQTMLFFVASVLAPANVVAYISCWGVYRDTGTNCDTADCYDPELNMIVSNLNDRWWCEESWLYTSNLDTIVFGTAMIFLLFTNVWVLKQSQIHRFTALLQVKFAVDAPAEPRARDADAKPFSKLVMCDRDGFFEFVDREDVLGAAAYASILPYGAALFWRLWGFCRSVRRGCLKCIMGPPPNSFHVLESMRFLEEAARKRNEISSEPPELNRLVLNLTPFDLFRVMDVGSGEMGFYSYWLDSASRLICTAGVSEPKLKYNKGQTFYDMFVTNADGVDQLFSEISKRFHLPTMTTSPNKRGSSFMMAARGSVRFSRSPTRTVVEDKSPGHGGLGTLNASLPGQTVDEAEVEEAQSPHPEKAEKVILLPILMCLTGANRQMIRDDEDQRKRFDELVGAVNELLKPHLLQLILYCPRDVDEAMYELLATEWVVQQGDLDVTGFQLDKAFQTLGARATLDEVMATFGDCRADAQLKAAFQRAGKGGAELAASGPLPFPVPPTPIAPPVPPDTDVRATGADPTMDLPASVPSAAFYREFEASAPLLRALVRARLFSGTLSAGSGSSQVTLRRAESLDASQVHSIPLGNRTPLVTMRITSGHEEALFSKKMPVTKQKARELLCGPGPLKETRPAWPEDGPVEPKRLQLWKELVAACANERGLPTQQRGFFVGISAVYYAAADAGCDGRVMERDAFLDCLERKRQALIISEGPSGRALANLTLVYSLVESVLHKRALIVCKRKWKVGSGDEVKDFLATWTLGLYLKHSGVLGVPLRVSR